MSLSARGTAARRRRQAPVFAALGDETRLTLIAQLCASDGQSITQLTAGSSKAGSSLTRQAITKHLRVLEEAGLVRSLHSGRMTLFEFVPQPLDTARDYLDFVATEWDQALGRLKVFVED